MSEALAQPQAEPLAWGAKVSPNFRALVRLVAKLLGFPADWLMACIAFESARTFSPGIRNPASSATGLIQFMERTALAMGVTTAQLAAMTPEKQLDYVASYFSDTIRARGPIRTLADCYMAILDPAAIGKPDSATLWVAGTSAYAVNAGLDANRDHQITKAEAAARVQAMLAEGLGPENAAA